MKTIDNQIKSENLDGTGDPDANAELDRQKSNVQQIINALDDLNDREKQRILNANKLKRMKADDAMAVTFEEKALKANSMRLAQSEALEKAKMEQKKIEVSILALEQEGTAADNQKLIDAKDRLEVAKDNVTTEEKQGELTEFQIKMMEQKLEIEKRTLELKKAQLDIDNQAIQAQINNVGFNTMFGSTGFGAREQKKQKVEQNRFKIASDQLALTKQTADLETKRATMSPEAILAEQASIDNNTKKLDLLKEQTKFMEHATTLQGEMQMTFAKGIEDMFVAFAQGSKSAKEAMRDFAMFMLKKLAEIAAQQLAMKAMTSMFGFADGGVIPMAAGGVAMRKYATGGIATQPTYLVGEGKYNEAVVPLPDGRTIPVEMRGGAGNNITVNVDANGGQQTTMDGEQGAALGKAIAATVMETIQREKRPGGVLSR